MNKLCDYFKTTSYTFEYTFTNSTFYFINFIFNKFTDVLNNILF